MTRIEAIRTDRLTLREFVREDWPSLHLYGSDPEVMTWLHSLPNTEEHSQVVVDRFISYQSEEPRSRYELALTLSSTGEIIGGSGIRMVWPGNREASMGYVMRRDLWGKGYATEAAQAMIGIGFELLGAHRVSASVDTENIGSIKVLEKAGMTMEGTFRQSFWSEAHGSWRDVHHYAILEDEWRSSRRQ